MTKALGRPTESEKADLYRALVESVRDYAIFVLDPTGHVRTWNPGAQRFKGYTAEEIIGRHFSTFYLEEEVRAGKPPYELKVAAATGRFEDEGWRVRKDGSLFWANVIITALRDDRGELTGFAKVTRDLTERRAAEEQARKLAAEEAAHAVAQERSATLERLNEQLQQQSVELESQTEEAQSLAEELEQTNMQLEESLAEAEEAREAAQAAERFSSGILASIVDPFVVHDRDWRFRYINQPAAEIFRTSRHGAADSLIGRVLWEVYPDIEGTRFGIEMRRAAMARVPVTFEAYYPERAEWSAMYCYPLPDGGLATQWKNITERKRAEESAHYLAKASELLGASLDYEKTLKELAQLVVPDLADWCSVVVLGEDGRPRPVAVAHVDPAKVRWALELSERYPSDPNAPRGVSNVLRTGVAELLSEIPDELLVGGAIDAEHLRIMRDLGLKSVMMVPLTSRDRVLGALTLVSAESGRRYTEADLALATELARRAALAIENSRLHKAEVAARSNAERANRAKSEFLTTMSHELRTPLNAIGGHVQLMEMGLHGPVTEKQREALERVERAHRHLLRLINDVLNLARIETGRVEYEIRPVLIREVLTDLSALVEPQFAARQIELTTRMPEDEPGGHVIHVAADREKLLQILTNVLGNAAKFTPPGGSVTLELSGCDTSPDVAEIRVTDTGPGIPATKLESIFEPFVQLDQALATRPEGTGLGLAISRDLARGMGGDLHAESVPGKGARLILTLPRAEPEEALASR